MSHRSWEGYPKSDDLRSQLLRNHLATGEIAADGTFDIEVKGDAGDEIWVYYDVEVLKAPLWQEKVP